MKFDEIFEINGKKLSKKYIESLSKKERLDLIEPIFNLLRSTGWLYPDNPNDLKKDWKKLQELKIDLNQTELFNNSSLCTNICKYFCHKFYLATEQNKKNMIELFEDDVVLKKLIANRLGLDWIDDDEKAPGVNEAFNLTFRMIIQGMRSKRLVASTSIFKPDVAKYMYEKYSNEGDTVLDYSAGFGARLMGAVAAKRVYIGIDPWTTDELETMANYLQFKNYTLINNGSEHVRLKENSIDFSFSSPAYFNQEEYSRDDRQAYAKGEDYFYNTYWKNTLANVKYMLKPGKWFGLNVKNFPKMVEMAKQEFGPIIEEINLRTIRSHLNKTAGIAKMEQIYMFKNNK